MHRNKNTKPGKYYNCSKKSKIRTCCDTKT